MATTVRQMLAGKPDAYAVAPTATVLDALQLMADKDIGAVLVIADGALAGIFTERDYARKVALQGRSSKELLVRDVMSAQVVTIDPAWTADRCLALMPSAWWRCGRWCGRAWPSSSTRSTRSRSTSARVRSAARS